MLPSFAFIRIAPQSDGPAAALRPAFSVPGYCRSGLALDAGETSTQPGAQTAPGPGRPAREPVQHRSAAQPADLRVVEP
jgi:hypothetical protein